MKFTLQGSRIICSRLDTTVEGNETYRQVVEFDANVDKVPPHVAARLTQGEVCELEDMLGDRRRIQENSTEKNMLEVLPGLIREATEILISVDQLDYATYEQLNAAAVEMTAALNSVRPIQYQSESTTSKLPEPEAQKERLESIKQDI